MTSVSLLDFMTWASAEGEPDAVDDAPMFAAAIDHALATGDVIEVPARARDYRIATPIERTLPPGARLALVGTGGGSAAPRVAVATGTRYALKLTATRRARPVLAAPQVAGSNRLALVPAAGIAPGDLLHLAHPFVVETGWHTPIHECHSITAVGTGEVQLATALEFDLSPDAAQTFRAAGGKQAFWYPSYYTKAPEQTLTVTVDGVRWPARWLPREGDAAHRGWVTELEVPAGAMVRIGRRQPVQARVFAPANVRWEGIDLVGLDSPQAYIALRGITRPTFAGFAMCGRGRRDGFAILAQACLAPRFERIADENHLYAMFVGEGTRGAVFRDIVGRRSHHTVSTGTFAAATRILGVTGEDCVAVVDNHPSFDTLAVGLREEGADFGSGLRASGITVRDWRIVRAGNTRRPLSLGGIMWLDNGALDAPVRLQGARRDVTVTNLLARHSRTGGVVGIAIREARDIVLSDIESDSIEAPGVSYFGVPRAIVGQALHGHLVVRYASAGVVLDGCIIAGIDLRTGDCPRLTMLGGTVRGTPAILADIPNLPGRAVRRFVEVRFECARLMDGAPDASRRFDYRFERCTFDGVRDFGPLAAGTGGRYEDCRFIGGSVPQ